MKTHYGRQLFSLLFVVLIVATFFRVYNLQSAPPGLYPDEAMNGTNAQEAAATDEYKLFYPENNGREGLFINIEALFLRVFGVNEPWVLRSVSAAFGILSVLGVFLLILELYRFTEGFSPPGSKKPQAGLLAAFSGSFLMAISFWHVNFSRIGFRAIMAPFFIVWAMYVLLKGLELADRNMDFKGEKTQSILLVLISGFIFGMGIHSYIAYRALPLFVLLVFVLYWKFFSIPFKKVFLRLGIFVTGAFVSAAPLLAYFAKNPADFFGRTSQISVFSSENPLALLALNVGKTILSFFWFGDTNWRHNYAGMGELYPLAAVLFIIGIIFGVRALARKSGTKGDSFIFLFAASLFGVALLPTVISSEGIPHALRAIIMIPAVFVLVGVGAERAYGWLMRKTASLSRANRVCIKNAFIFVFFVIPTAHLFQLYFNDWAPKQEVRDSFAQDYVDVGRQINALPASLSKYVVVNESSVDVRGIPVRAQTTMFITDTFTERGQREKNVHYVLSKDRDAIPPDGVVFYIR